MPASSDLAELSTVRSQLEELAAPRRGGRRPVRGHGRLADRVRPVRRRAHPDQRAARCRQGHRRSRRPRPLLGSRNRTARPGPVWAYALLFPVRQAAGPSQRCTLEPEPWGDCPSPTAHRAMGSHKGALEFAPCATRCDDIPNGVNSPRRPSRPGSRAGRRAAPADSVRHRGFARPPRDRRAPRHVVGASARDPRGRHRGHPPHRPVFAARWSRRRRRASRKRCAAACAVPIGQGFAGSSGG